VGSDRAGDRLDSIIAQRHDSRASGQNFSLSQIHKPAPAKSLRDYAANQRAPDEAREKTIFLDSAKQHSPENAAFLRSLYGKALGRGVEGKK